MKLLGFQANFVAAVENPAFDTVVMSGPRGLGKTFILAHVLSRALTPGDSLYQPGKEVILGAASLEQARLTLGFIRETLETVLGPDGKPAYRFLDSTTRLGCTHKETNTKLRVISSNAKTSFGLVNVGLACIDEPGGLEIVGGQMLADSLFTAQGKVGSAIKLVFCGTLAPMATRQGHWWYDLVTDGTKGRTYVQYYAADNLDTWDSWATIRKCNPLVNLPGADAVGFRAKLKEERESARADSRLKARFLSYRLNVPSGDESQVLLTVDDWKKVVNRPVPPREGRPVVGVDLGGGRAWSAAVAVYPNGRVECKALAPGIPDLAAQERRDRVPKGLYSKLHSDGLLYLADGLQVQSVGQLWDIVRDTWGRPKVLIADRFREKELSDTVKGCRIESRVTRWSDAAFDIRALRRLAKDGPLAVAEESRTLLQASLAVSTVLNDDAGNFRLVKKGSHNQARDDISAALTLAAGLIERQPKASTGINLGLAG